MKKHISYLYTLALSQTARSTYLTTFGAGINGFMGFVFTIVVARSVSPADFGLFSVVMNLLTILLVIADAGFNSSILKFLPQAIRDSEREKSQKIIKVSFLTTLFISGLLALLLFLFSSPLAEIVFLKGELILPFIITSVALIGLPLTYLFVAILQGQQRFLFGVITESSVYLLKVLAIIILFLMGRLNLVSVLIILSLTSFTGVVLGIFFIRPSFFRAKTDLALLRTLFGFGAWVALARIATAVSGKIDTLMLVRFVETAEVGFYAAAQRMTFIFPVMVTGVAAVLQPKFASLKTLAEAKTFTKKSSLLFASLVLPIILLFILAPWFTVWIYGQAYEPAVIIFRWLLLSSFFFVVGSVPIIIILYYLGDSKFFTAISLFTLLLIVFGNLILIPRLGVIGPAISLAFAYGAGFLISSLFVFKRFKERE